MNAKGAVITIIATLLGFAATEGSKKILTDRFNPEEEKEREEVIETLFNHFAKGKDSDNE